MKLKTLEIKGFKSFPDKTIIHFDEHITGVVGPNGCGKSNIVDAIRWAIGEQKISALRSENLETLIFNGSKTRSASNIAEVNITFENTKHILPIEFNTVTVTRRFYRSGDSEYRLNDIVCRLRDIQNLFLDTGIASDSYAIIALGDIDEIIKDSISRRIMIEKAAGISIYKDRKKEAERKLESTLNDLNRIDDLLFEINNQLKTLENQSKKASKYIEFKREYKTLSIESAKILLLEFNTNYNHEQEIYTRLSDHFLQIKTDIASKEAFLEKDKAQLIEQEHLLQEAQKKYHTTEQEITRMQSNRQLLEQKKNYLTERKNTLMSFILEAEAQIQTLQDTLTQLNQKLQQETAIFETFTEQQQQVDNNFENQSIAYRQAQQHLNDIRQAQQATQQKRYELEKQTLLGDATISNLKTLILKTQQTINEQTLTIAQKQNEREAILERIASNQQAIVQQNLFQDSLKNIILQEQELLEQYRLTLAEENRILDARKNEYDLLKSMMDSMEGYSESLKYLHHSKEWNRAPLLSDVLFVQEKYRTCIEQLFENYLNYYVVDNKEGALQAIHLLKREKKGKANFFILDHIPTATQDIPVMQNTIAAMSIIECEEKYKNLANHLLRNVFITEATHENKPLIGKGQVLLDISGELLEGYFIINGGSVGTFEGKRIGMAKNIEKLLYEIQEIQNRVATIEQRIQQKKKEIEAQNIELNSVDVQLLNKQKIEFQAAEVSLHNWIQQLQQQQLSNGEQIENWEKQIADITTNHIEEKKQLTAILETEKELVDKLKIHEVLFSECEKSYQLAQHQKSNIYVEYEKLKSKIQSIEQDVQYKNNSLIELQNRFSNSKTEINQMDTELQNNIVENQTNEQHIYDLLRIQEIEKKGIDECDKNCQDAKNSLKEQEQNLRLVYKQKDNLEEQLNICKDKLNNIKLEVTASKERLQIEFKVNWETLANEPIESTFSAEELKEQIEKIKKRIENLGEVNTMAVEAYEEMKKRYDFIIEQKDDLVNARESLLQTIDEISGTSNQRFHDTFTKIRDHFQRVFKSLFTDEDMVDLVLEYPDNIAETGINIIARPKGKKPSTINQLSGGEKTLTAVALLFAIYLVKPAPFCIMDEVDAPLDDLNVNKFSNMIREFSKDSQFIIVTHNKMTMAALDVIYGVTMQEAGVSKLVPVDFRNLS